MTIDVSTRKGRQDTLQHLTNLRSETTAWDKQPRHLWLDEEWLLEHGEETIEAAFNHITELEQCVEYEQAERESALRGRANLVAYKEEAQALARDLAAMVEEHAPSPHCDITDNWCYEHHAHADNGNNCHKGTRLQDILERAKENTP